MKDFPTWRHLQAMLVPQNFFQNEFVVAAVFFKKNNHNHHRCFFWGGGGKLGVSPRKLTTLDFSGVQIRLTGFHKHIAATFRRIARSSPLAWSSCNRPLNRPEKNLPIFVFFKKTSPFFGWVGFFLGGGSEKAMRMSNQPPQKKKHPRNKNVFFAHSC